MAYLKVLVLLVVIAISIEATPILRDDHNIYSCFPEKAKYKAVDLEYHRNVLIGVIEHTVNIPETGFFKNPITCIIVTDLDQNGKGGYPTMDNTGGVGFNKAGIHLKSQLCGRLNFRIEVWTEKNPF